MKNSKARGNIVFFDIVVIGAGPAGAGFAGYAWDMSNPFVRNPTRIDTLSSLCRSRR